MKITVLHSPKGLVQVAALTLPDEEGRLDAKQVNKLLAYYKTVSKMEAQPRPRINYVDFNIKYPDRFDYTFYMKNFVEQ